VRASVGWLAFLVSALASASPQGAAHLVKDINTTPVSYTAGPSRSATAGAKLLFEGPNGLWTSNGTASGTYIVPGTDLTGGSFFRVGASLGDLLFYRGGGGARGEELWRTDGTASGTKRVFPGRLGSQVGTPVAFRGEMYFEATDGTHGRQLWKTDGNSDAVPLMDAPGSDGFVGLAAAAGRLYFASGSSFAVGAPYDLYQSDGTAAGTRFVRTFVGESPSGCYYEACASWPPGSFIEQAGLTYFIASDGVSGLELWRTDGTSAGTSQVRDVCPGRCSGFLYSDGISFGDVPAIQIVGERLFFFADDGARGMEPWTSDGTEAGTRLVKDIEPGAASSSYGTDMMSRGNVAFFGADDGTHGYELWRSDGTEAGTFLVADLVPGKDSGGPNQIVFSGENVFFTTGNAQSLWRTNATGSPPVLLATTVFPRKDLADLNGELYFPVTGPEGVSLWRSDGTAAGTSPVTLLVPAENATSFAAIAGDLRDHLIFGATDGHMPGLWETNDTEAGAASFSSIAFYGNDVFQSGPFSASFLGSLFFSGSDGSGRELWRTDGTSAGTRLVRKIGVPGAKFRSVTEANPCGLQVAAGLLYFRAFDGDHGLALWRSDGTEEGTLFVSDAIISCDQRVVPFAGSVYFGAVNQDFQPGLWRTNGTPQGTELFRSMSASSLTAFGGRLFFVGEQGNESGVWKSDGTAAGTVLFHKGGDLVQAAHSLFFVDSGVPASLVTLWASDGTTPGTVPLAQFALAYRPSNFTSVGTRLFFVAGDTEHGFELWTSDGTPAGTKMVRDIASGADDSSPMNLTEVGGLLLFSARDPSHGWELWRSDGSEAGTWLVQDIFPGPGSSSPANLTLAGSVVYFTADDGRTGRELWAIPLSALDPPPGRMPRNLPNIPWRH
jgi:ELWxxDGT repeat protein